MFTLTIGSPSWTPADIVASLDEVLVIYADRTSKENQGGMKVPHMFAGWFKAR